MASLLGMIASGLVIGTGFAVSGLLVHKADELIENKIKEHNEKPVTTFNDTRLMTDKDKKDNVDDLLNYLLKNDKASEK